jgi:ABC-type amino acid transport substrate-binding protein
MPSTSFLESINLVRSGAADATCDADIAYYHYIENHPTVGIKVAATSTTYQESAVVLPFNTPSLRMAVNEALNKLDDEGTLAGLSTKYLGGDFTSPPHGAL